MMSQWHIFLGLIASLVLYLFNINLIYISIFFVSSFFFIDLDHVPRFVIRERSLNPIKFFQEHSFSKDKWNKLTRKQQEVYKKPIFFLHNIETLFVFLIISFLYYPAFFVFIGFAFHLLCDLIYQHYLHHEKYYKFCLVYTIIKNKGKKDFFHNPSFLSKKNK